MDAATAGGIAAIVLGLLCLRRRRCGGDRIDRDDVVDGISEDEMQTYSRLSAESQNWGEGL
jgi:MYXO-CTERM domain-containing protein